MTLDPALIAVAGALSTVAGLLFREMTKRSERCEKEAEFWRDRALRLGGLAELALDEAERRGK